VQEDSPDKDLKRNSAWQMYGLNSAESEHVPVVDSFEHGVVFSDFLKANNFLASNINISKRKLCLRVSEAPRLLKQYQFHHVNIYFQSRQRRCKENRRYHFETTRENSIIEDIKPHSQTKLLEYFLLLCVMQNDTAYE
jgi:hypothetical protein